jgi:hypothetical protein
VDYCIGKKQVVRDMQEQKLIHLLPFLFPVPNHNFMKYTIYVTGFRPDLKSELKNLLKTLGANVEFDL